MVSIGTGESEITAACETLTRNHLPLSAAQECSIGLPRPIWLANPASGCERIQAALAKLDTMAGGIQETVAADGSRRTFPRLSEC